MECLKEKFSRIIGLLEYGDANKTSIRQQGRAAILRREAMENGIRAPFNAKNLKGL
jgi:hypothetical protein